MDTAGILPYQIPTGGYAQRHMGGAYFHLTNPSSALILCQNIMFVAFYMLQFFGDGVFDNRCFANKLYSCQPRPLSQILGIYDKIKSKRLYAVYDLSQRGL